MKEHIQTAMQQVMQVDLGPHIKMKHSNKPQCGLEDRLGDREAQRSVAEN